MVFIICISYAALMAVTGKTQTHNQVLVEQLHAFLMKNKGWEVQKM